MEYWEGYMDWPLDKDWICEICGNRSVLIWGLTHAVCRCSECHMQYTMRNDEDEVVSTPICMIKEDYRTAAIEGHKKLKIPLSEFTKEQWTELGII